MKQSACSNLGLVVLTMAVLSAILKPMTARAENHWPEPVEDNAIFGRLIVEQLEHRWTDDAQDTLSWDVQGWLGTDYDKLWLKTEGDRRVSGRSGGEFELQLLYSRLIAPFWDLQIGARYDETYGRGPDASRFFAVIGFQGTAPYRFEMEPALFVSDQGDVSARLTTTRDVLLTQRLVIQPRVEINAAIQEVRKFGVGSGVNDFRLGLRLRYEFRRELAPYVGMSWVRRLGATESLASNAGDPIDELSFLAGVRLLF